MPPLNRREIFSLAGLPLTAGAAGLPFTPGAWPASQPKAAAYHFPRNFQFGVATSAYQIEGAVREDGRGPGIWDIFCHTGNHIREGHNADIACNHYHLMPQDIALIAAAGIPNYRFSISWSRLYPDATGRPNPKGFAFYDRLLAHLQAKNITPWLTLYHWDLPQYLQETGGWTNRETAYHLAAFADRVSRYFGGRINNWMVLNEAAVHAMLGHGLGFHAPGLTGKANWVAALHHMNLGQGLAIQALRANLPGARIGTVASCEPVRPSTPAPPDIAAAARLDAMWNGAVLDPLFLGRYPDLVEADFAPLCCPGDLALCQQKIDLLGVNYYNRLYIHHDSKYALAVFFGPDNDPVKYHALSTPMSPDGLHEILMRITERYNRPEIFISENGFATVKDGKPGSGLEDDSRLAYLAANLTFLQKSIADGAHVTGYFVWSIMDNFEWDSGTKYRFGMVDVDFATLARTPKQSYYWYASLVQAHTARHELLKA